MMEHTETVSATADSAPSEVPSRLAVLSLASGLIFCCPLTGFLAFASGAAALLLGRSEPAPTWRKYAWSGLLLGLIGSLATPLLAWGVGGWWEREGRILFSGPNNALYELYQGAPEAFLAEFEHSSERPSRQSAEAFRAALQARHGEFVRSLSDQRPTLEGVGPWSLDDYLAQFMDNGEVSEIPVSIGLTRTSSDILKLVWIEFDSDSEAPLRFPPTIKESDG